MRYIFMILAALQTLLSQAGNLDDRLAREGYVDVTSIDPTIKVSLMYAGPDNFVGVPMYRGLTRAWLHPDAARALAAASAELHRTHPGYNLKVCDAARPMSVQRTMYNKVKGTPKANYVANPARGGGLHNFGLAVDITIVDSKGRELPMGTKVDHLGPEANIDREDQLVRRGVITAAERDNRRLLRRVMTAAGFKSIRTEWWHFQLTSRTRAKTRYKLLNF